MKKKIHPQYQEVLFVDSSTGDKFLCGTTLQPEETEEFEGKKYPVYRVPVSSASHPFFTGNNQFMDTEGRVDKFTKKYQAKKAQAKKEQAAVKEAKEVNQKKKMTSKAIKSKSKAPANKAKVVSKVKTVIKKK